jgi:hypothetical protein
VIDRAAVELPSPQRHALEVALLLREAEGRVPDQRAIAFGVLGALRAIADAPVLVAVDDVQWLDGPSAFALWFAARRLRNERVGFLLSLRSGGGGEVTRELQGSLSEERTYRVHVGPLSLGALHRLLQTRLSVVLSRPTLWRVHEMSGGNPFFALELARALRQQGLVARDLSIQLTSAPGAPASERDFTLIINGNASNLECDFLGGLQTSCAASGPVSVPANSTLSIRDVGGLLPPATSDARFAFRLTP